MNGWTDNVDQANRDQVNAELERLRHIERAARDLVWAWTDPDQVGGLNDLIPLINRLCDALEGRASSSPPAGGGDTAR
jgi:hypothetical protein